MYLHELIQRRFSLLGLNSYTAEAKSRQLAEREGTPGLEVSVSSWDRLSKAPSDERDWAITVGGTRSPLASLPQIRTIFAVTRTLDLDPLHVGVCAIRSALGIPEADPAAAAAQLLFPGWDTLQQGPFAEWIRYGRALLAQQELEQRLRTLETENAQLRGASDPDGATHRGDQTLGVGLRSRHPQAKPKTRPRGRPQEHPETAPTRTFQ